MSGAELPRDRSRLAAQPMQARCIPVVIMQTCCMHSGTIVLRPAGNLPAGLVHSNCFCSEQIPYWDPDIGPEAWLLRGPVEDAAKHCREMLYKMSDQDDPFEGAQELASTPIYPYLYAFRLLG